jgi:hypothetical protein
MALVTSLTDLVVNRNIERRIEPEAEAIEEWEKLAWPSLAFGEEAPTIIHRTATMQRWRTHVGKRLAQVGSGTETHTAG